MRDMSECNDHDPVFTFAWLETLIRLTDHHKKTLLMGAAVLQLLVLVGMIALHTMPLIFGTSVKLRVAPVDPRSLFRGDYVILNYGFSRISPADIEGLEGTSRKERRGRRVYVLLEPSQGSDLWEAGDITLTKPESGVYIKGHISSTHRLQFGIEAWFVQEGKGKAFEDAIRKGDVFAEIAVTRNGKGALRQLVMASTQ